MHKDDLIFFWDLGLIRKAPHRPVAYQVSWQTPPPGWIKAKRRRCNKRCPRAAGYSGVENFESWIMHSFYFLLFFSLMWGCWETLILLGGSYKNYWFYFLNRVFGQFFGLKISFVVLLLLFSFNFFGSIFVNASCNSNVCQSR